MKRTFKEWETDMCDAIKHINDARTNVVLSLFSRVWNHNDQLHDTWMKSMDGLNALERQLTGELSRARRRMGIRRIKNGGTIHIRRRKAGVRYCSRITAEHRTISRWVWHKWLMDAMERVTTAKNRAGNIDDWTEMTQARLAFAHIWYKHKLRFDGHVSAEDFMAYIVMTAI